MSLVRFSRTPESKSLASLRISVGIIFLAAGIAKLLVPIMVAAFEEQLRATGVPFRNYFSLWFPILEITIGYFLLIGKFTRFWSVIAIAAMCFGVYVHMVIDDPALFPLEPAAPIVPIAIIGLSAILFIKGAGTWSKDLDIFEK